MNRPNHLGCSPLRVSLALAIGLLCCSEPLWAAAPEAAPAEPLHEQIDRIIEADHVGTPAPLAGDAEFIRRVYLDLIGRVPPVEAVRSFLADNSANKRAALIDRLLADPAHAQHLANVFDVMLMERRADKHVKSPEWQQYLLESFEANKPLNVLAREILASDGVDEAMRPAVRFYLDREGETNLLTRDVGRIFFGMDVQCAQCHNHPLIDSYLQSDYYGIFAFLNRSFVFEDKKAKKSFFAEKAEGDVSFTSVFTEESGSTGPRLPGGEPIAEPTFAKGEEYQVKPAKGVRPVPKFSRREKLAELATDGSNEAFNRNLANRLWALMLGRGLVEPVDLHHPDNPPVHPELLRLLTERFVAMDFDVRAFLRQIALSRTYQRGFDMPAQLVEQAERARQQLASLQSAQQQCVAGAEQASAAHLQAQVDRSEAKKALDEVAPSWQKANEAFESAQAESTAAGDKLAELQGQLAVKQPAARSLQQAAEQTRQAAAGLKAAKEADATALAEVAKTLQARSEQLAAEAEKLVAASQAQEAARDAAAEKLAAATRQRQAVAGPYEQATKAYEQRAEALDQQRRRSEAADRAVRLAERRVEQAERLAEVGQKIAAVADAEQQLQALNAQIAAEQQTLAVATAELASRREALAAAGVPAEADQAGEADQADQAGPAPTAELQQQLAEAEAKSASVGEKLQQLRAEQQQASQTVASVAAQRDELLVALTQDWSRRFVVATMKPLQPEPLAWSLMEATGMLDRYREAARQELEKKEPLGETADEAQRAARRRAVEAQVREKLAGQVNAFINLFGAGAGQPQDEFFATVDQALFFANGSQLRGWLAPSGDNLCGRLIKLEEPAAIAEELYLSALCRLPTQAEIDDVASQLAAQPEQKAAVIQDLAWALLTSAEFRFNH